MTAKNIYRASLLLASCVSLAFANPSLAKASGGTTSVATGTGHGESVAVQDRLRELAKAISAADAKAEASLWTEDAAFQDDTGKEWKGRAQLEQRFSSIFSEGGKQEVDFQADLMKPLADSVILVEGKVLESLGKKQLPVSNFSMLFVKQNGKWMICRASENPIAEKPVNDPLNSMSWLIGDWATSRNGKSVTMKYEWMADKNFIHCRYNIDDAKEPDKHEVAIIGWDRRNDQIVSWHFYADGGFGRGVWFQKDNQWREDLSTVDGDGKTVRSTHVLSVADPNTFSWQAVARTIDGEALADSAQLKIERVK